MKRNAFYPPPPRLRILTRCGLFFACFFFFLISNAKADKYTWNTTVGDWTNSANWTSGPAYPSGSTIWEISNGGTVYINAEEQIISVGGGPLTTGSVSVFHHSSLYLQGQNALLELNHGSASGLLDIQEGAQLKMSGAFTVYGNVAISNGGSAEVGICYLIGQFGAGGNPAALTVSGNGSSLQAQYDLRICYGNNILNILDGSHVSVGSYLTVGDFQFYALESAAVNIRKGTLTVGDEGIVTSMDYYDNVFSIYFLSRPWEQEDYLYYSEITKASFNIYGSGSDISTAGGYNKFKSEVLLKTEVEGETAGGLRTNVLLDSTADGGSPIKVTGGTIYLEGEKLVTAWGAAVQKSDNTFTMYEASGDAQYSGTFTLSAVTPNMKIVSDGSGLGENSRDFVLGFNESVPAWDMTTHEYYYTTTDEYDGWVKPLGDSNFTARFVYEDAPNSEWVATLLEYINGGMSGSGASMTLVSSDEDYAEFYVPWLMLNGDYDLFGWGLSHLNGTGGPEGLGTNIRLEYLKVSGFERDFGSDVPEPATWAMMLLGGAAMVGMRLRRRK